jgi:hypothetical protein
MELNDEIDSLNSLLRQYGERNWNVPKVFSKSGASDVIRMYGGMGSINDLYICKINGHNIAPEKESEVNEKIHSLLSSIYNKCASYEKTVLRS